MASEPKSEIPAAFVAAPAEFSARSSATASVLLRNLRAAVDDAVNVIRTLPPIRLVEAVSIQGYDTSVLAAIFHVVEHFSGHTYQIIPPHQARHARRSRFLQSSGKNRPERSRARNQTARGRAVDPDRCQVPSALLATKRVDSLDLREVATVAELFGAPQIQ